MATALASLCAAAGGLLLSAAPALAVPPEKPEVLKPEPLFATTATFKGVLSPKAAKPNEGGTYQFIYRAAKACKGAGEKFAPASPGISLGQPAEPVNEPVSGLTQKTEYTVCLSMTNLKSETAVSAGVSFKTTKAAPPEAPEATEVIERKATTATRAGLALRAGALPTKNPVPNASHCGEYARHRTRQGDPINEIYI